MLNLPIYLYPNILDVILDLDNTVRGVNNVMYQRDLKIQKGIKNKIQIQFKNSDQKRISISNTQTFVFSMIDTLSQRLVLEKELTVLDESTSTRGMALLTLSESDTVDLARTSYTYGIKLRDTDGTYLPAYTNTYYGQAGTLFLANDVYPVLQPSQEITVFQPHYNPDIFKSEFKSGNIYAHPEYNSNNALHTMAMYMTRFKGKVIIQGSLNNSPGSSGKYATIATRIYRGFTGIDYLNFNGIFSYVRVIYIPDTAPAESNNDNPAFFGSFDKVLYRC